MKWNVLLIQLGLCEMRWKNPDEMSTDDIHKVYFSAADDIHENRVGFLVHKDMVGAVLGYRPISRRLRNPLRGSCFQCHHSTSLVTNIWTR